MWLTWHSSPWEAGSMFHHFGFGHRLVTTPVNETWWKRRFVTLEAGSRKECSFYLTLHLWDTPPWNQPPSCGETQATRRGSEGPLRTSINRQTRKSIPASSLQVLHWGLEQHEAELSHPCINLWIPDPQDPRAWQAVGWCHCALGPRTPPNVSLVPNLRLVDSGCLIKYLSDL